MRSYRLDIKKPNIITLMILSAFASMGAILMMPALPEISDHFKIHTSTTQLVVTFFLLGYSVGQLLYGPIANRFGRKFAIYTGILIATIGSIFSIISAPMESFHLLIAGRFLEAIGSSAGLSVSIAMINDFYFETDARRIMGLLMFAFAIIPGIAVTIGGFLVQFLNWQSCFYFLLLYGLLLIYPTMRLSETNIQPDMSAMRYRNIFENYSAQLKMKKLVVLSLIMGLSGACVYVFGAEGPFIGIHLLHVKPAVYGSLALLPYVGTLIGSIIVVKLSKSNPMGLIKKAFMVEIMVSVTLFFLFYCHIISLMSLLIPMGFFCICHPIISATCVSLAMHQTQDKSNGSSTVNFVSLIVPVLMTFLLTVVHTSNPIVLPFIFLIGMVAIAACLMVL